MLGLGNSIVRSSAASLPLGTYTSEFTSGIDSWEAWSVEGNLTLTGAQNLPDGSANNTWLKVAYDTNQVTGVSGIIVKDITTGWTRTATDYFEMSMEIYLKNGSGGDGSSWGGTDDVSTRFRVGTEGLAENVSGADVLQAIDQDVAVSFQPAASGSIGNNTYQDLAIHFTSAGDKPASDAIFFVRNIVVDFYAQ